MAYKVNYGLKRAERARAKQAKKELKVKERAAQAAERAKAREQPETTEQPHRDEDPLSS